MGPSDTSCSAGKSLRRNRSGRHHHVTEASSERSNFSDSGGGREVTIVEVTNPHHHQSKNKRMFTDFEISLQTNSKAFAIRHSSVRRRYSDFIWLKKWLHENNEGFGKRTPSLPPKRYLKRFEANFIQERMKGLQKFLKRVIEHNVFLSDKALHLFLQSSLTIDQIDKYLKGKSVNIDYDSMSKGSIQSSSVNSINSGMLFNTSGSESTTNSCGYSPLFVPSQSLNEIPERCERMIVPLSCSCEGSSSCGCSFKSDPGFNDFQLGSSHHSSSCEDSATESDGGIVITIDKNPRKGPHELNVDYEQKEQSLDSSLNGIRGTVEQSNVNSHDDSGLFIVDEHKGSKSDADCLFRQTQSDSGQDSSVESDCHDDGQHKTARLDPNSLLEKIDCLATDN